MDYVSTEDRADIQYHCLEGFYPSVWKTSQCLNSTWSPDPLTHVCVPVPDGNSNDMLGYHNTITVDIMNCEVLPEVIVYYSSTTIGNNATYYCRNDKSVVYTSQCIDGGVWWPNITCNKRGIVYEHNYYCLIISHMCGAD